VAGRGGRAEGRGDERKVINNFSVYVCGYASTIDIRESRVKIEHVKIDWPVGADEMFSSKIQQVPRRSMRHIAKHRASNNTEQATTHRLRRDSIGKWV
jgi:hypothetical protein